MKVDISDIKARYRPDLAPDTKQALLHEAALRFIAARERRTAYSVARLKAMMVLDEVRLCATHGAAMRRGERKCGGVTYRRWLVEIGGLWVLSASDADVAAYIGRPCEWPAEPSAWPPLPPGDGRQSQGLSDRAGVI